MLGLFPSFGFASASRTLTRFVSRLDALSAPCMAVRLWACRGFVWVWVGFCFGRLLCVSGFRSLGLFCVLVWFVLAWVLVVGSVLLLVLSWVSVVGSVVLSVWVFGGWLAPSSVMIRSAHRGLLP